MCVFVCVCQHVGIYLNAVIKVMGVSPPDACCAAGLLHAQLSEVPLTLLHLPTYGETHSASLFTSNRQLSETSLSYIPSLHADENCTISFFPLF